MFTGGSVTNIIATGPDTSIETLDGNIKTGRHLTMGGIASQIRFEHEGAMSFRSDKDLWFVRDNNANDLDSAFVWLNDGGPLFRTSMLLDQFGDLAVEGQMIPNGVDLAEYFPTLAGPLEPGSVMAVDPDHAEHVQLARRGAADVVLGIVSTAPGVTLGGEISGADPELLRASHAAFARGDLEAGARLRAEWHAVEEAREDRVAIALAGRVPVRIGAASAPISAGDAIGLGSVPGTAARHTGDGPVIGLALESWNGAEATIVVFVQLEHSRRGTSVVPEGSTRWLVSDRGLTTSSRPVLTFFDNPGSWHWIASRGQGFFIIEFGAPALSDVEFSWQVLP